MPSPLREQSLRWRNQRVASKGKDCETPSGLESQKRCQCRHQLRQERITRVTDAAREDWVDQREAGRHQGMRGPTPTSTNPHLPPRHGLCDQPQVEDAHFVLTIPTGTNGIRSGNTGTDDASTGFQATETTPRGGSPCRPGPRMWVERSECGSDGAEKVRIPHHECRPQRRLERK